MWAIAKRLMTKVKQIRVSMTGGYTVMGVIVVVTGWVSIELFRIDPSNFVGVSATFLVVVAPLAWMLSIANVTINADRQAAKLQLSTAKLNLSTAKTAQLAAELKLVQGRAQVAAASLKVDEYLWLKKENARLNVEIERLRAELAAAPANALPPSASC